MRLPHAQDEQGLTEFCREEWPFATCPVGGTGLTASFEELVFHDAGRVFVADTLLFDGRPQFGTRNGAAVKIDGVWKVSRDTECALPALGGLTCPPRSNP